MITITLTVDDDEEEEDNDDEEEEKEQNVDDDDDDIRLAKENWCVGLGGPGRGKVWVQVDLGFTATLITVINISAILIIVINITVIMIISQALKPSLPCRCAPK